ncbi:unnamed protein product [Prorocentrum cordatum]|uniref:Uncharacterized protein n=1 Tax=Prorocentrum cordatum TaxID=2364126 RepID=A0ABN9QYV0_9DINO|nr:unnamed protein product [Polarella glacialis]
MVGCVALVAPKDVFKLRWLAVPPERKRLRPRASCILARQAGAPEMVSTHSLGSGLRRGAHGALTRLQAPKWGGRAGMLGRSRCRRSREGCGYEAIIAFVEAVLNLVAETVRPGQRHDARKVQHGQMLRPHALQVCPGFVEAIFRLIAGVPTRYVQETLPCVLESVGRAFPQEFPSWLEAGMQALPPSVASKAEQQTIGHQILQGDERLIYDAIQDLCYRCEQVALRNRAQNTSTTEGGKKA